MKLQPKTINLSLCLILALGTYSYAQSADASYSLIEEGLSSWYGSEFAGRQTANGEIFNPSQFTAAHLNLPFGTIVKVTNLTNGLTVEVRINDRGPYKGGRIIDLSKAAADSIGLTAQGVGRVKLEAQVNPKNIVYGPNDGVKPSGPIAEIDVPERGVRVLQIISLSTLAAAENLADILSQKNLRVLVEASNNGKFRVVMPDVPVSQVQATLDRLSQLGYKSVLVRQR